MSGDVEEIPELDLDEMVADMRPPSDDDVPRTPDWTPLDSPAKVVAFLHEINARRRDADRCAG